MPTGIIKKLMREKGFGFISGEDGDMFFHSSGLSGVAFDDLQEGQKVTFEKGMGPKGPKAENVSIVA